MSDLPKKREKTPLAKRKLTDKEQLVLAKLAETCDWNKAIAKVYGYQKKDPIYRQRCWEVKHRILSKEATGEVLSALGLDIGTLGVSLKEGLNASKLQRIDGQWTEVPDHQARGAARSLLSDLLGVKQKQQHSEIYSHTQSLVIHVESPEQARVTAEKVKREWGSEIADPNYKVEEQDDDS
jgi:hypothetical protein